jgi:hypothetical protein
MLCTPSLGKDNLCPGNRIGLVSTPLLCVEVFRDQT